MNTLTIVAHKRPEYTADAITAAVSAMVHDSLEEGFIDKIIFSIDPGNEDVTTVCHKASQILSDNGIAECVVYVNTMKFGVAGNSLLALARAFEEHRSDFNVAIEDDAMLRPDALVLASWFLKNYGGPLSEYTLMSMCNHRDFGRGQQNAIPDDPSYVVETPFISSPFAWCMSNHQWPFVKSSWNKKKCAPTGWDFSLSYAMRLERRRALHPVVSRCKNIGREGGENQTPESFDRTEADVLFSDGEYPGPYKVVARLEDDELMRLNDWMMPEYPETFK